MADTTFVDQTTVVTADWLNDVNDLTYSSIYAIVNGVPERYTTLALAVTGVGSNRCTIVVRKDITMAANATLPSTALLRVENKAQITTTGYTLTLNGGIDCGRWQCFAGTGTVAFAAGSMPEVLPEWWGANADGSTDSITPIQAALEVLKAAGGGLLKLGAGDYRHSVPIKTYEDIRILGAGEGATFLTKTGTGTITLTGADATAANATLVCLGSSALNNGTSSLVNGSIWISDADRALNVEIAYMTIQSTGSASTTANAKFGIAGVGVSDSTFHDLCIQYYTGPSFAFPTCWFSDIYKIKSVKCNQSLAIENGTSDLIHDNYSLYCHTYGYYFRDMSYCTISNNACDGLNNVSNAADYTDRAINSKVYVLDACNGITFQSNGSEQCFGTHVYLDSCVAVSVKNNVFNSPASSYTGASQVALFYVATLAHGVSITDNFIFRNNTTAVQGSAVGSNHHDLYVSVASENHGFTYRNNWTCNTKYDAPSTIFGNMVPAITSNLKQGSHLHGDFTPTLGITSATGVSVSYGGNNKGRYVIQNGWMFVDINLDVSSVSYTGSPVYPEIGGLPYANKSAKDARLIVDQSANVTWPTTEGYWVDLPQNLTVANIRNRTDGSILTCPAAFASGATNIYMHVSGWIYVGDVLSVV